jgi:hypothetical protein
MSTRIARAAVVGLILVIAAGCQSRLNVERPIKLDQGKDHFVNLDAPKYDQTVALTLTSDVPVDVYVFLERDQDEVDRLVTLGKSSEKLLASRTKVQSDSLEAKIPAKERAVVMLRPSKSGTANLKIVGK